MTPAEASSVKVGSIVHSNPEWANKAFANQLIIVTEVKAWGIQGYVKPLEEGNGLAYIRVTWDNIELTGGRAAWVPQEDGEEED